MTNYLLTSICSTGVYTSGKLQGSLQLAESNVSSLDWNFYFIFFKSVIGFYKYWAHIVDSGVKNFESFFGFMNTNESLV